MVDTHLYDQIILWANWRIRRGDGGLGYPKHAAFAKQSVGGGFWTPEMDSVCHDVDKAVCALKDEIKDVLVACYCLAGTKEGKCRQLGCCVRTYDNRLNEAHRQMRRLLLDIAAGIPLPVQTSVRRQYEAAHS